MQMFIRQGDTTLTEPVEVDLRNPPLVLRPETHPQLIKAVSLNWDRAVDDNQHLRRCPVCGCQDLYTRQSVPRLTAFILVLCAVVLVLRISSVDGTGWAAAALVVVLLIDLAVLIRSRPTLTCYRCRSRFRKLKIPHGQPRWNAALAERHRREGYISRPTPPPPGAAENPKPPAPRS